MRSACHNSLLFADYDVYGKPPESVKCWECGREVDPRTGIPSAHKPAEPADPRGRQRKDVFAS